MSREDWQVLVKRYCPEDKRVCNCGNAYYTLIPNGAYTMDKDGNITHVDHWACEYGCGSNQISAREYIAACVLAAEGKDVTHDK